MISGVNNALYNLGSSVAADASHGKKRRGAEEAGAMIGGSCLVSFMFENLETGCSISMEGVEGFPPDPPSPTSAVSQDNKLEFLGIKPYY